MPCPCLLFLGLCLLHQQSNMGVTQEPPPRFCATLASSESALCCRDQPITDITGQKAGPSVREESCNEGACFYMPLSPLPPPTSPPRQPQLLQQPGSESAMDFQGWECRGGLHVLFFSARCNYSPCPAARGVTGEGGRLWPN